MKGGKIEVISEDEKIYFHQKMKEGKLYINKNNTNLIFLFIENTEDLLHWVQFLGKEPEKLMIIEGPWVEYDEWIKK